MMKKIDLPSKICVVCNRPFSWRKKWEKCWDEVKYCSERCRGNRNVLMYLVFFLFLQFNLHAQWKIQNSGTDVSFRAISVVNDQTIWVGGSKGTILRTTNGGELWQIKKIKGAENCDFRGIAGIDAQTAVAMSAGPAEDGQARIYRTTDGGDNWTLVWQTADKGVFLDNISFWNTKNGLIMGDPIDDHWYLLRTNDSGKTWQRLTPKQLSTVAKGEAAFAASNSSMVLHSTKNVWIGSGGHSVGRVFYSKNRGKTWDVTDTPMQANASSGIFGLRFFDELSGIAVGGDYKKESADFENVIITNDGGKSWQKSTATAPTGLKEAIIKANKKLVAVGPSGSCMTLDGGQSWQPLTSAKKGFHALGTANGRCWAVGAKGLIAVLELDNW